MNAIQQLLTDHIDIWTAAETEKKSGRGRASNSAASVYGIKKLRELILELAVQGRLIQRNGPWKNLKLSDIGSWAIGSGFPTSEQGHQNEGILFVKVSDMNLDGNEKFILSANNTISGMTASRLRINVHLSGTVIFPKIGGAIATNKRRILTRPTAIDNNCLGLTPKNGVSSAWLYLFLSSIDLSKYQAGTSVPALAQGVLKDIPTMLPDMAEQELVVAKVDELMAMCDRLETLHSDATDAHEQLVSHLLGALTQSQSAVDFNANWQRIDAHFDTLFTTEESIDNLKQTLLQLAVMGKLLAQDANDEPASELLKRIEAEKIKLIKEGKIKNDKSLSAINAGEKQFDLPLGWEWVRLQSIIDVRDGTHDSPKNAEGSDTFPLVTSKDFLNGNINFETAKRISRIDHIDISKRSLVEKFDILFSMIGGNIGNQVMVIDDRQFSVKNVALFKYYDRNLTDPFFIKKFTENLAFTLQSSAVGGAQPFVALGALRNIVLALPPQKEQHRIVAKVDELMALCDKVRSRITAANQQQKKLADVLVEHAVIG